MSCPFLNTVCDKGENYNTSVCLLSDIYLNRCENYCNLTEYEEEDECEFFNNN